MNSPGSSPRSHSAASRSWRSWSGSRPLPAAFALALATWRAILGAGVVGILSRSLLRSRLDETRFRDEAVRSFTAVREAGLASLPGTWVFLPAAALVGAVGAALMAVVATSAAGVALFAID